MMATSMDDELLSPFDPMMVDDRHRALTRWALRWSIERAVDPDHQRHAKEAFLATAFEVLCEPPRATLEESRLSIKFLLLFFCADDAGLPALDEFILHLDGRAGVCGDDAASTLCAYHDELMKDFRDMGLDSTGFRAALRGMAVSMQIEKRSDKSTMTEEEYRRLRGEVAAISPFVECWQAIRGCSLSRELGDALRRAAILDITSELVYLTNDIGSLDRDEKAASVDPKWPDLNLVLLYMHTLPREAALDKVIALHNQRIIDFRDAERLLLSSEHGGDPTLHAYLEILRCTVRGNLATTKHLIPMRYEDAETPLSRLHVL